MNKRREDDGKKKGRMGRGRRGNMGRREIVKMALFAPHVTGH